MNESIGKAWVPLILSVAPNGARKTKKDHPALPITPRELAETALACREAGASMIHLHVRDEKEGHSLSVETYRRTIEAIRAEVGMDMVVQVTSEAVGIYSSAEQMAMVKELRPEAVSLALRELYPENGGNREAFSDFSAWIEDSGIIPQWILYDPADVRRFEALRAEGVVAGKCAPKLFVLGRYSKNQLSEPNDLLPFLEVDNGQDPWSLCAFGAKEAASAITAAGLGGHARIGFENNLLLPNGTVAPNNAAAIATVADGVKALGRPLATAEKARAIMRGELDQ